MIAVDFTVMKRRIRSDIYLQSYFIPKLWTIIKTDYFLQQILRFAAESNFDCEQGNIICVSYQCWIDNLGFVRFKIPNFCIDPENNMI